MILVELFNYTFRVDHIFRPMKAIICLYQVVVMSMFALVYKK